MDLTFSRPLGTTSVSSGNPEPTPGPAPNLATLDRVTLKHFSGATAEVSRRGAQVLSWKRANGVEMLFLAQNEQYSAGEPMRGGIPVVFPQFGSMGTLPMHGLIKAAMWEIVENSKDPNGAAYVLLRTSDTEVTRGLWPHPFRATVRVTLDEALSTSLTIENTGNAPFEFQSGLHTYLRVGDVRRTSIQGLERATYQDWRRKGVERREGSGPLRIVAPINRVYLRRPDRITLYDESRGRTVLIDRAGFGDVVVWNPGEKEAPKFGLAEGEWAAMLAVEPAQVQPKVQLTPGQLWSGTQRLRLGET